MTDHSDRQVLVAGRRRSEVFNVGGEHGNCTKHMIVPAALQALDAEGEVKWTKGGSDARNYSVSFAKIRDAIGVAPNHTVMGLIESLIRPLQAGVFADVDPRPLFHGNRELDGPNDPVPGPVAGERE